MSTHTPPLPPRLAPEACPRRPRSCAGPGRRGLRAPLLLALAALAAGPASAAPRADDAFVAGYASAILERELGVQARVGVEDGVVRLRGEDLDPALREKLTKALADLDGVRGVRFDGEDADGAPAAPRAAGGAGLEVLPKTELFEPLLADPRWPHFAAAWHRYRGDEELRNVATTGFGESIPLVAADAAAGRVELALQAGVFSIFDLDASSFDLVNSDFLAGLALSWRRGDVSVMARILHQSSHLGDEFLLRSRVERINLSFEELHLLLSWDLGEAFRLYGGGGWLLRTDPEDLEEGSLQLGLEFTSPRTFFRGLLRPVAGVDLQARQESDWDLDVSARAGLQLENPRLWSQRIQLLLELYDGRSPNGQFFDRDVRYLGVGTHVHF